MACSMEGIVAKRANLVASRFEWGNMDLSGSSHDQDSPGKPSLADVRKWLSTTVTREDAKHEPLWKGPGSFRSTSCDDDLALGVEASLYENQGLRTVQDFLRWTRSSPTVCGWDSFNSGSSEDRSGPLSVMDILNLWNDDPEELLLDLGFGCDEPDLSGRIPARFINYPSQAQGINLQVFLEAQKSRLDLENPDVSSRFRQVEVLQQVTTAFSSLVRSPSLNGAPQEDLPPEARDRRRRMGMLFRRASQKTIHNFRKQITLEPTTAHQSHPPPTSRGDNRIPFKKVKTGLLETKALGPLAEEQAAGSDAESQPQMEPLTTQDGELRSCPPRDSRSLKMNAFYQRRKSPAQARESFEMEEIHSFDEGSLTGSFMGGAENLVRCMVRTSSCQSDSSGFLEEPFIPPPSQQESPAPDLIKALSCLFGGSTESHCNERPSSPSASSTKTHQPSALTPTSVDSPSESSTYPPQDQPSVCGPFLSPASSCLSDLKMAGAETPTDQDQSPPEHEHLSPCSSSSELLNTNDQSQTNLLPAAVTSISSRSSLIEADSVIGGSEEDKTENIDRQSPILPTSSCDCDPSACSTSSTPSANPNVTFSSTISSFKSPGDSQLPSFLPSSAPSDFQCASPEASFSQSPENNQKDPPVQFSRGDGLSDPPTCSQTEEAAPSLVFELEQDRPLVSSTVVQDSPRIGEFTPDQGPSPDPSISVSESSPSLELYSVDYPTGPTAGEVLNVTERSISQWDRPYSTDDNTDIHDFSIQEAFLPRMDHFSLDLEGYLERNGKREVYRHPDPFQTSEAVVYFPDIEGSVSNQREMDPHVPTCCFPCEFSTEAEAEGLREVCQMDTEETGSEPWRVPSVLHEEVPGAQSGNITERKGLFEIQSLDVVFQTSVDGSEGGSGDVDSFLEQLDTERQVYWAEPINVSSQSSVLEESSSVEASDGEPLSSKGAIVSDSVSLMGRGDSDPATSHRKPLSRSVSVQMSSSPSSHIIHRKDVPFVADLKRSPLPADLPLDTSSPFRAVQSWTEWQMRKNNFSKMLSHGALDAIRNQTAVSTDFSEIIQRPTLIYSSSPSLPLLSRDWNSYDYLPKRDDSSASVSIDKGLWSDEEEEVERGGDEDEKNLWQGKQTDNIPSCCCSCNHQSSGCYTKQHTVENIPYSLDELEEMMLCLQQFCSVLCNMEEQLSEDQAAVYSSLSEQDRERVRDIEELRRAVKKEAAELEMQLNELAHHYDDSLKLKMHRLLDEQSFLCTQLRVSLPGKVQTSLCPTSNRTVATQCSLLPWMQSDQVPYWTVDSLRQSPPGSDSITEGLGCSHTKADKVDFLSFLQRLKESLRHSVNTDSLE
ncbi:uncharacterized protein itprid1 [Halichoeres trimaculatus]|uniref:uncharacterized protein itprid1 n=1 Tax=Halichoeres trimaculatus TaxID=147232 RepID=UPI003D9ECFBF